MYANRVKKIGDFTVASDEDRFRIDLNPESLWTRETIESFFVRTVRNTYVYILERHFSSKWNNG